MSDLIGFLKKKTGWAKETPSNIICRCPFCGDSKKHTNKGHLYIHKSLPMYHCVRCDASGRLSYLLHELDCQKPQQYLESYKDAKLTPSQKVKHFNDKLFPKRQPSLLDRRPVLTTNSNNKINYLLRRNVDIDDPNISKLIIWEPATFIANSISILKHLDPTIAENNMVKKILSDKDYRAGIDSSYIGFISNNGYHITCRRIDDNKAKFRYLKLSWIGDRYNDLLYFASDGDDDLSPDFVVSEGVFDAIQLYQFLKDRTESSIISIVGGKRFYNTYVDTLINFVDPEPKYSIFFDMDITNKREIIAKLRKRFENPNIYGYMPLFGKDPDDSIRFCKIGNSEPFLKIEIGE
ncbi:MAG: hypothetical protein GXO10_04920 [Crenarchaeota archaeon]|nr:hypothetical protein [Thermoproteota archaeon]